MENADIAVIGLAVMGQNLILNMNDQKFKVIAYNRSREKIDHFMQTRAQNTNITAAYDLESLVMALKKPRKIMLMVKAGKVVDQFIDQLLPYLEVGDIIIDGGNSNYKDTQARVERLQQVGIHFIGTGVSGGEEGARYGPSLMPGGSFEAWATIQPIFQAIAAKTPDNEACCQWVGQGGAGHFVKMVHNGIEYGDMQLICEAYQFMKVLLQMDNEAMGDVFHAWNQTGLKSFLIEITANILQFKDNDGYVIDRILDTAGQKGTGKWTGINAMDAGVPLTLIGESVFTRCLSALKETRVKASQLFPDRHAIGSKAKDQKQTCEHLQQALLFAKIVSYAQGYMLMKQASEYHQWQLNFGDIALMWREGCIIRSSFLDKIKQAYTKTPDLDNLLFDDYFQSVIQSSLASARYIVSEATAFGIPCPGLASALTFFDGLISQRLPANLLQAQRDYFGAHMYERVDKPRGQFFHTDWIGSNAQVWSSTYNV
jgi:6-phosphogluconate dehydrogenase